MAESLGKKTKPNKEITLPLKMLMECLPAGPDQKGHIITLETTKSEKYGKIIMLTCVYLISYYFGSNPD